MPNNATRVAGPQPCNALWIGNRLTAMGRTCLASFVETGHRVRLFAYEPIDGVPPGIEMADAAAIVPADRLEPFLARRSFAAFSNLFRYELIARDAGVWIDCDLLSVRPLTAAGDHIFGFEAAARINNAVLRLPADSPVLAELRSVFSAPRWKPPWNNWRRDLRDLLRMRTAGSDYSAVISGPRVLTHLVEKHGLAHLAASADVFYPVPVHAVPNLRNADFDVRSRVTERTVCIHLCSSYLADRPGSAPARGSFLRSVLDGDWRAHLPECLEAQP